MLTETQRTELLNLIEQYGMAMLSRGEKITAPFDVWDAARVVSEDAQSDLYDYVKGL